MRKNNNRDEIEVLKKEIIAYENGCNYYSKLENQSDWKAHELEEKLNSLSADDPARERIEKEMKAARGLTRTYKRLNFEQHEVLEKLRERLRNLEK